MKNARVITLGVLVLAGGLAGAGARGAGPFFNNTGAMDYELHEQFTNAPRFAYTANLPVPAKTDLESLSGAINTDGSGRIAGLVYARVFFDGPSNHTNNYGAFTLTVTGNTSNRGTNPWVRLAIHGNGYTFDGISNHPNASVSLNFNSTNRLVDVPAAAPVTVTNTTYSVTAADGTTQVFSDGPASRTNSAFTFLSGPIRGNIRPGSRSPVNGGHQLTVDETAALVTAHTNWTVVNGTNFVEQVLGGGLVLDVLSNIDAQVIHPLPGSRLFLNAWVGSLMELSFGVGSANTNIGKWSATFTGVAFARGSNLQANGTLGPEIVAFVPTADTNTFPSGFMPQVVPNAIQTMTVTGGRIFGQQVLKMLGATVPASPP